MDLSKVNLTEKMKNSPLIKERIKGMNFGFLSKCGYYATDEAKRQPAIMRGFGVNCVTLNLNVCQEKYSSTKVFSISSTAWVRTNSSKWLNFSAPRGFR